MHLKHLFTIALISISFQLYSQLIWHHTDGPEGSYFAFITSTDSLAFLSTDDFLFTLQKNDSVWSKTRFIGPKEWVIHNDFFAGLKWAQAADTFRIELMTSSDFGRDWSSVDITHAVPNSNVLAVLDSGIFVLDVNEYYMYHTRDTGITWDKIRLPGTYGHNLQAFDNRLYLSNDSELWVSDSTGLNWSSISHPVSCTNQLIVQDSIMMSTGDNKICYSHDYGNTWSSTPMNTFANRGLQIVDSVVYFSNIHLYQSKDLGQTWNKIADNLDIPDIHIMSEFDNQMYISSFDQGIFRRNKSNGSTFSIAGTDNFTETNTGIGKARIHEMSSTENRIYATTAIGLFTYDISHDTWSSQFHLVDDYFKKSVDCNDNGLVVYAPGNQDYFLLSEDHAQTWDTIHSDGYLFLTVDEVKLIGNTICVFDQSTGYYSTNKGASWKTMQISPNFIAFTDFKNSTYSSRFSRLYHTKDDGLSWNSEQLTFDIDQIMSTEEYLFIISRFNTDPAALYVSEDGLSWLDITQNLPASTSLYPNEEQFFISKVDSSYFLFWGEHGVYETKDTFQSWNLVLSGFYGEHFLLQDSVLFMGDEGMYRSNLNELMSSTTSIVSNSVIEHLNIYPNPSAGSIDIWINLENPAEGTLNIYAIDGSLIKTIWVKNISKNKPVQLQLIDQGIYFISFTTGNQRWLGKAVIGR